MNTKTSLAIILTAMLLADTFNGVQWQGTGSGMNNTVLAEIWNGLEGKIEAGLRSGNENYIKEISDRLNARWDPAWNVVLVAT